MGSHSCLPSGTCTCPKIDVGGKGALLCVPYFRYVIVLVFGRMILEKKYGYVKKKTVLRGEKNTLRVEFLSHTHECFASSLISCILMYKV